MRHSRYIDFASASFMEIIYLERKKDCLYSSAIGYKVTEILHSMHLICCFILLMTNKFG